ncbi:hypothetical protein J6590_005319 [Homalodisca vitripennis]|nr:hypothetical protein J6590_005319 [Homalodisca vitripennis]
MTPSPVSCCFLVCKRESVSCANSKGYLWNSYTINPCFDLQNGYVSNTCAVLSDTDEVHVSCETTGNEMNAGRQASLRRACLVVHIRDKYAPLCVTLHNPLDNLVTYTHIQGPGGPQRAFTQDQEEGLPRREDPDISKTKGELAGLPGLMSYKTPGVVCNPCDIH